MANKLTVDNQGNKKIENAELCFLGWWYSK